MSTAYLLGFSSVTPRAGVWIEIGKQKQYCSIFYVTPRAGVWIEIHPDHMSPSGRPSLPVRECGLKYCKQKILIHPFSVTPRAGVWIEICLINSLQPGCFWSLPVRECGLKFVQYIRHPADSTVTPRAGVWIEIVFADKNMLFGRRHSPCGSVD